MNKTQKVLKNTFDKGYRAKPWGEVHTPSGEARVLFVDTRGYLTFTMGSGKNAIPVPVHRLVAYERYGDAIFEKGIHVRHLDGNKLNNEPYNIAIGTQSENFMDRPKIERVAHAKKAAKVKRKLTEQQASDLRVDHKSGLSYSKLVEKYGIAKSTVSYIVNNKTYRR